MEQTKRFISSE